MRPSFRRCPIAVLVAIAMAVTTSALARELPRAASINVCGDQFLLMLAAPQQIASLSWQSTSPLSFHAKEAARYRQNRGTAEEMLDQNVDLIVTGDYGDGALKRIMTEFGVRIVELPLSENFEEVEKTVLVLADVLGRRERGEQLVAGMRARLLAVRESAAGEHPSALYFRPDGGGAGAHTFVHAAIEAAGFRNLQAEMGDSGWTTLPFERVVMAPPDVFMTSFFDSPYSSVRGAFRHHPTFWALAKDRPLIQVPGNLWPCASPLLVNAAEYVAAERLGIEARERGIQ